MIQIQLFCIVLLISGASSICTNQQLGDCCCPKCTPNAYMRGICEESGCQYKRDLNGNLYCSTSSPAYYSCKAVCFHPVCVTNLSTELNGEYIYDGTANGAPSWKKIGDTNYYIYWYVEYFRITSDISKQAGISNHIATCLAPGANGKTDPNDLNNGGHCTDNQWHYSYIDSFNIWQDIYVDAFVTLGECSTDSPTANPTDSPTANPTKIPSSLPSKSPTNIPTFSPTHNPTISPLHGSQENASIETTDIDPPIGNYNNGMSVNDSATNIPVIIMGIVISVLILVIFVLYIMYRNKNKQLQISKEIELNNNMKTQNQLQKTDISTNGCTVNDGIHLGALGSSINIPNMAITHVDPIDKNCTDIVISSPQTPHTDEIIKGDETTESPTLRNDELYVMPTGSKRQQTAGVEGLGNKEGNMNDHGKIDNDGNVLVTPGDCHLNIENIEGDVETVEMVDEEIVISSPISDETVKG